MLNEEQIRSLLVKAGDTVTVDPVGATVTALPPRRWRTVVAATGVAATLVGIAGVGLWLAGDEDGDDETTTTVLGGVPEGTVPSVFAHTRATATQMLEGLGLEVEFKDEISCEPAGRPIGTEPATGTPFEAGETVTLLVAHQAANTDCMADRSEPWAFVDFATGRGPAPEFANEVRLFVDGELVTTMPGETAAKGVWPRPSALTELATAAGQVMGVGDDFLTPTLAVQDGTPPDEFCVVPRPPVLGAREAQTLTIDIPVDGQFHCPARVSVYRTDGKIDAVVTWTEHPLTEAPEPVAMPDTVGMTVEDARNTLTAAGYTVSIEELETCDPNEGIVVEQAPGQTPAFDQDIDPEDDYRGVVVTLVVEVPHSTRDCAALDAAAEGFIRFARGGAAPEWAAEVELLLGYTRWELLTTSNADDPAAWSMCAGVDPADCVVSPLAWIDDSSEVRIGAERENYECELSDRGGLPAGLDWSDAIHLFPPKDTPCDRQWDVALWIDDAGRITSVNLLLPETVAPE